MRAPASVVAIATLAACLVAAPDVASAKTYAHGKTAWFRSVTIGDGDVVRGNLDVVFGDARCENGAVIEGDVRTYFGSFDQEDGCTVDGHVVSAFDGNAFPIAPPDATDNAFARDRGFLKKLAWDVVAVFAFLLFPLRVRIALDRVEKHPGLSAAGGTVLLVAALPIAILLIVTVIGIPLVPLEAAALLAGLWIGNAAVALLIGRRLHELIRPHATPTPLAALVLGLVAITAAETLPVVGWAVTALVALVGLGATALGFVRETAFAPFAHGRPTAP